MASTLEKAKGKVERVTLDWGNITPSELPAGTPIGADGRVHNDGSAKGLLMRTVNEPWSGTGEIITAGYVDLVEAQESYGSALTNEARCALYDIHFSGSARKMVSAVAVAG